MMRAIGAVDTSGTKIAAGAVTENGAILSHLRCATAPKEGLRPGWQGGDLKLTCDVPPIP